MGNQVLGVGDQDSGSSRVDLLPALRLHFVLRRTLKR